MTTNSRIVDVVGFVVNSPPLFVVPLHKPVLLLPLCPLPLPLRPGTVTDRCLLILDPLTQFPQPRPTFPFLFRRSPLVLVRFIPKTISKQMLKIVSAVSKLFPRNNGGGLPTFLLLSRPQRRRMTFSSDTTDGLLTRDRIRMYRVHQG